MLDINVSVDTSGVEGYVDGIEKQIPYATSVALNRVAYKSAKKTLPVKADQTFKDGATAHTKRAFSYKKSNKSNLVAHVFIDPKTHDYMRFMIQGGTRFPNKKAILVSTRQSKLNKYGNLTRGTRKRMAMDRKKFFYGVPKGRRGQELNGIWERYGRKTKKGGQRIRKVAHFVGKAQYRPIFPFGEFVEGVVFSRRDGVAAEFERAMEAALS